MHLTFENIKSITHGAVKITECDGKINFSRFSDEQYEFYNATNKSFAGKTLCTASVILDFYTNSRTLLINWGARKTGTRNYCTMDIYEDGVMVGHFGDDVAEDEVEYSSSVSLSDGKKRITIYMPALYATHITSIEIDDGASLEPVKRGTKALIVGDSITQGYDALYPSLSYANLTISEFNFDAVNQAIGGERFNPGMLGSEPVIDAEIITVAYGTNDWSKTMTVGEIRESAEKFFAKLKVLYPKARIFYISPIWRGDINATKPCGKFYDAVEPLKAIAKDAGATVIDGVNLIPHDTGVFSDKRLHPNDLGFTQYARALKKELIAHGVAAK